MLYYFPLQFMVDGVVGARGACARHHAESAFNVGTARVTAHGRHQMGIPVLAKVYLTRFVQMPNVNFKI